MANKVEISNLSLNMVGQQVIIAALTDASVSARLCQLNIDQAIREVLGKGKWKSARGRATLVQTTPPAFEYAFAYLLPTNYLKMHTFNDLEVGNHSYPNNYTTEGRLLLTDESVVKIGYIKDLTLPTEDVNVADPNLTELFVLNLAIKLCWPLQMDRSLRDSLEQQLVQKLRTAKTEDSRNERPDLQNSLKDSTWLPARVSSTDR
jgi:hypothetical protein